MYVSTNVGIRDSGDFFLAIRKQLAIGTGGKCSPFHDSNKSQQCGKISKQNWQKCDSITLEADRRNSWTPSAQCVSLFEYVGCRSSSIWFKLVHKNRLHHLCEFIGVTKIFPNQEQEQEVYC